MLSVYSVVSDLSSEWHQPTKYIALTSNLQLFKKKTESQQACFTAHVLQEHDIYFWGIFRDVSNSKLKKRKALWWRTMEKRERVRHDESGREKEMQLSEPPGAPSLLANLPIETAAGSLTTSIPSVVCSSNPKQKRHISEARLDQTPRTHTCTKTHLLYHTY